MGAEPVKPRANIVLGRAGSGKTERLIQQFLPSLGQSLFVVTSDAEADWIREELAHRTGYTKRDFKTNVLPFRRFVHEIATRNLNHPYQILSTAFQRLLVEDICQRYIHADDYLGQMRGSSGFVTELIARFREWKLACITPQALRESAERLLQEGASKSFVRKTEEFARLFGAYDHFLRSNGLWDSEDQLHIATQRLHEKFVLPGSAVLVLVDGYFRLNRAQIDFLRAIVGENRNVELTLTLPYDPSRPLLFASSERTLQTLRQEFDTQERYLERNPSDSPLSYLETHLFTAPLEAEAPTTKPEPPALLFDAPNNYVEAEMVAREFRRIFERGGYQWDDFMIVLRTQGEYAPILSSVFERYDIPLGVDGAEALGENPLIKTLLSLFRIILEGWQRDDVLSFLKSSYISLEKLEADLLRRAARQGRVREGRESWLALVENTPHLEGVKREFERIVAFEESLDRAYAPPSFFVERLRSAVEAFGVLEQIERGSTQRAIRDRAIWKVAEEVLDALTQMVALGEQEAISAEEFFQRLNGAWHNATALAVIEEVHVRVVEPYETRQRPAKVVAVMGMTERIFPRRITEDPFFRESERDLLREIAGIDLEAQRGRADDERLLFYFAVTAPREQLILSCPRTSDDSDALPSFFLDEVRDLFSGVWGEGLITISRTLADVAPRAEEIVSSADRLLSACANLFEPVGSTEEEVRQRQKGASELLKQALQEDRARVESVLRSRKEPSLPKIREPLLQEAFRQGKSVYSVSELETFRRCPFQYLLRYVWRLHAEDEFGQVQAQGTLLHRVLRRYYRAKQERSEEVPTEQETLLLELRSLLEQVLGEEELDEPAHRVEMIRRLLWDALGGFAERETLFAPLFKMTPKHFELAFGMTEGGAEGVAEEDRGAEDMRDRDLASTATPLLLVGRDSKRTVQVCGVIDRVDLDVERGFALAMDYKLGNPPELSAVMNGESLQLPLYLLALERIFGIVTGVACYDAMQQAGRPRLYMPHIAPHNQFRPAGGEAGATVLALNRTQFDDMKQRVETTTVEVIAEIEQAKVVPKPGKHCAFCSYKDVCRTTSAGGHDGAEILSLPEP